MLILCILNILNSLSIFKMVILNYLSNSSHRYLFRVDFWKFLILVQAMVSYLCVFLDSLGWCQGIWQKNRLFLSLEIGFIKEVPDAMILVFWMLSFKPSFSLLFFTFIKRLFSYSSLSAIRVVLSAYLRLLICLPAILIPACASSSPAFLMMYSAEKLNKQGDNTQPWHTPFPIGNQSVVPCPLLTVASWPAYGFNKRQVWWPYIPISFRIFHSLLGSTQSKALHSQ